MSNAAAMIGGPTLPLGSVLGVAVRAHWTLIVALAFAAWLLGPVDGTILALSLFASVLAHELAHAVVAVKRRVRVVGIELRAFGGLVRLDHTRPASARDELAIAIAGPLASLAVAGLAFLVGDATDSLLAFIVAVVNTLLFLSNALPLLPLDGGRALRALLAQRMDRLSATRMVALANAAVAVAVAAVAVVVARYLDVVLGLSFVPPAVVIALLGVFEVRRVQADIARAHAAQDLAFDPLDAPWMRPR